LYYLSVYVKSFKELFLYIAKRNRISQKASAKVLTISETTKFFKKKVSFLFQI